MELPTTSRFTRILRSVGLLLHLISGLAQAAVYPYLGQRAQERMAQNWAAGLLSVLGIRLRHRGTLPDSKAKQVLLAANHISWLDVYSLIAVCPARFVAKSEVAGWPVLGWFSKNAGTLFIERSKRGDTARINVRIAEALSSGYRVAIFPEGTTSNGTLLRHFHASLLQPAVTVSAAVFPVAIRYTDTAGAVSEAAPYVNISLLESVRRIVSQPWIEVELTFIEPMSGSEKNRRELARGAESAIADALSLPLPHKGTGTPPYPPDEPH